MTADEFNEKYKHFLEKDHYGLDIDIPELTEYLDKKFQEFITTPNFSYSQIKTKFGMGRFYCEGLTVDQITEVEKAITEFCKKRI